MKGKRVEEVVKMYLFALKQVRLGNPGVARAVIEDSKDLIGGN